jgi:hypothetical protein
MAYHALLAYFAASGPILPDLQAAPLDLPTPPALFPTVAPARQPGQQHRRADPSPEGILGMTTAQAHEDAAPSATATARHLAVIADALGDRGIACQVTRPAGTPVLTTGSPTGPNAATVAIDPDMHAESGLHLDCICVWTPAEDTTPQVIAATIATVLRASSGARFRCQPSTAEATRLTAFLSSHPEWSAFWDPRYGLWRAAEDDPASVRYVETPDADAVMAYITSHS